MSKRLFLTACTILLSACGDDSTGPGIFLDGTYTLSSASGSELPVVVQEIDADNPVQIELLSGSMTFTSDGRFSDVVELRYTQQGVETEVPDSIGGTYRAEGTTIRFAPASSNTYTAIYDVVEDRITTIRGGVALDYTR